jgi:PKD repeat protein
MGTNALSRRTFLKGSLTTAALGGVGGLGAATPLIAPAVFSPAWAGGETPRPLAMAMHVHASFSEGAGSMEAQLDQASRNGVDVVWWTEHEFRMAASGSRDVVHFTGMTETENTLVWTWTAASSGSLAEKSATFVSAPTSPGDPGGGALRILGRASASSGSWASYQLNGQQPNTMNRGSLAGTTICLDVNPTSVGATAYVAVFLTTSFRPAYGGQAAGTYSLEYRIGGEQAPGSAVQNGRTGIVTLAAPPGVWTTLTLDPAADISAIWPWIDGRDASLYTFGIGTAARSGGRAEAYVDNLRFVRTGRSGDQVLATQAELMAGYQTRFPGVTQQQALELSMLKQHVNWFGGTLAMPPPGPTPWKRNTSSTAILAATQRIHDAGGLASYNHPFGSEGSGTSADSQSAQDAARRSLATELIGTRAYGCDVLEVGFPVKGGVEIGGYLGLWDALSRNGVFLTGTGVSDDHTGQNWLTIASNFFTWAWADSTDRGSLTAALAAGRVFWGNPAVFRGQLDLLVDGAVPMGAVSVDPASSRTLQVLATDLPPGATVEVVRGRVDFAGPSSPDPVVTTVSLPASSLASGSADVVVDTTTSCFVRVVVRSSAGKVVAGSNPVWLLTDDPPTGIPLARRVGPIGPVGPRATFTWTEDARTVGFDSSSTRAGDAPLALLAWDFDDGQVGDGPSPTHEYAADGTYTVVLTVTDEAGRIDVVAREVTVSTQTPPPSQPPPPAAALSFVGSARLNASTKAASVTVPSEVRQGDTLVLFVTTNSTAVTLTVPAGYSKLAEQVVGTQVSRVFLRTAGATDAGSALKVTGSKAAKLVVELLAYRGSRAAASATATASTQKATTVHRTPTGVVVNDGSWVVSYWIDKSPGTTTAWTPPPGVTVRGTTHGSAGGALSSLSADSGSGVVPGPCGGLVASANGQGATAVAWTVVLDA